MTDQVHSRQRRSPVWFQPYLFAAAASGAAVAGRLLLDAWLDRGAPLLLLVLPIIVSGWYAGGRSALSATALNTVAGWYFLVEPRNAMLPLGSADVVRLAVFATVGAAISMFSSRMHRALALSRSEEQRFRRAVINAPFPLMLHTDDGEVLAISESWEAITGYTREDLPSVSAWSEAVFPATAGLSAPGGEHGERECQIRTRSGQTRTWSMRSARVGEYESGGRLIIRMAADLTERKRAEEETREAHQKLQSTIDSMTDGLLVLDRDWRCSYFSQTGAQILGMDRDKLLGARLWDVFPEGLHRKFYTEYHVAMETGEPRHFEDFYPAPLNIWFECHCYPSPGELAVYFRDITKRKQVEESLRRRTAELDSLISNAPIGLAYFDREHRYVRVNQRLAEINGIVAEEHAGRRISELLPVNAVSVDPILEEVFRTGMTVQVEVAGETPKEPAVLRHWLTGFYPVLGEGEEVSLVGAFVVEISERKRVEQALRRSTETLQLALDAAGLGTFDIDIQAQRLRWDERSVALFGYKPGETYDYEGALSRIHPDDRARVLEALGNAFSATSAVGYEVDYRVVWPDGSVRWIVSTGLVHLEGTGGEARAVRLIGINQDVTERKTTEMALRESEERFRTLAEAMPHLVWEMSPSGHLTYTNRHYREYVDADANGTSDWASLLHPLDVADFSRDESTPLPSGFGEQYEARLQRHDGLWRWFSIRNNAVHGGSGQVTRWVGTATDVDGRHRAEIALRDSEARFRSMIDAIPQLAWMADAMGYIFWYNRRWYDYSGTTLEEMRGSGWTALHHADHVDRVLRSFQHSVDTGEPWEDTFPLRGRDGSWRWFLSRALPIRDSGGNIVTWFGTNTDITEQMAAEEALRESERHFRELAEIVPGLVWTTHGDGAVEYFNSQWYAYTGQSEAEALAWGWRSVVHPDDLERCMERWMHSVKTGIDYEIECRLRRYDGLYRWHLGRGRPLRDSEGGIQRWFGANTDIHEQKEVQEALRRSNEDLQQFAYVASHDLQEPLRTVVTFGQLVGRQYSSRLDEQGKRYLDYVIESGSRMSRLIRDLLAYSRATSDADRMLGRVSLQDVLSDVIINVQSAVEETGASIVSDTLPTVWGDASQLRQVLQNLISNALKYRNDGEIPRIEIRAEERAAEWLISVSDNGQGFSQEFADKIFGIFKRLHGRHVPGTGIGLAICKTVIERHGGRIWASSESGQGATFYFTLPKSDHEAQR